MASGQLQIRGDFIHQVQLEVLVPLSEVTERNMLIWTDCDLHLQIQEVSLQPEACSNRLQPRSPWQPAQC